MKNQIKAEIFDICDNFFGEGYEKDFISSEVGVVTINFNDFFEEVFVQVTEKDIKDVKKFLEKHYTFA